MTMPDCLSLCHGVVAHAGWDSERDKDRVNGYAVPQNPDSSLQSRTAVRTIGFSLSHHTKSGTEVLLPLKDVVGDLWSSVLLFKIETSRRF